jgi:AcrR family transcriptional regulator
MHPVRVASVRDTATVRLPRGRHNLTRDEVEQAQRLRIVIGLAETMRVEGYVGTSVAQIIRRAGVSRETFYQLYSSKLDCFLAAFDLVSDLLVSHLELETDAPGTTMERVERTLTAYLDLLVAEPAYARLFVIEVHAAGPEAMRRRAELQHRIGAALADRLGATSDAARFACDLVVAAISAMVTGPLAADDEPALRALEAPILEHVRALVASGVL